MKKVQLILFAFFCFFINLLKAQSLTYSVGFSASLTGKITPTNLKSDGSLTNICLGCDEGYLKFDLGSHLPAGAIISSVSLSLYKISPTTISTSTANKITTSQTLDASGAITYSLLTGATMAYTGAWTANPTQDDWMLLPFNAAGIADVQAKISSTITIGVISGNSNSYTFEGNLSPYTSPQLMVDYYTPACVASPTSPTNAATGISLNASLTWPTVSLATNYDVYFGTTPDPPFVANVLTNIYTPSTMLANTTYFWKLIPKNAMFPSTCSTIWSFTTSCAAVNVPYTENFDAVTNTAIPDCSLVLDVNNDGTKWVNATINPRSAPNALYYSYNGTNAANDWWFTPGINMVSGSSYQIKFSYRIYNTFFPESMELKTGVGQTVSAMGGAALWSVTNDATNMAYTTITINYTATSTGVRYFGWHANSVANEEGIFLDDISITLPPIAVNSTNNICVTGTAVTINTTNANNNKWIPLYSVDNSIIAEVNANGNDLGLVTPSIYISSTTRKDGKNFEYMNRNITISPATQPTIPVLVRLYFTASELASLIAAGGDGVGDVNSIFDIVVTKNSQACTSNMSFITQGNEQLLVPTSRIAYGSNGYYIQLLASSFSTFFLNGGGVILPVNISSISGSVIGTSNSVYWTTTSENNNNKFIVESSTNGIDFTSIGEVSTKALNGNSNSQLNYSFVDASSATGKTYYRLQIIGKNGNGIYSQIVTIRRGAGKLEIVDVRPNPTKGTIYFNVLGTRNNIKVTVLDLSGKTLLNKGLVQSTNFSIDVTPLAKGMYILEVSEERNGEKAVYKIVKD